MDVGAKSCFVFDLDGTVYLGDDPIPGTVAFIRRNLGRKDIYFLTNNTSKSLRDYARKLERMGVSIDLAHILSPLLPLVDHLVAEGIERVYPVGNAAFQSFLRERLPGIVFTDGPDCQAVVLAYDTELTYAKLVASALLLQRPEVRFFATHPDLVCPSPKGPLPDVGSFLKLYEAATGRVPEIVFGRSANSMRRIFWYGATRPATKPTIERASSSPGWKPGRRMTNALATASRRASGLGTTAASATASYSISTLSSSNGLIR